MKRILCLAYIKKPYTVFVIQNITIYFNFSTISNDLLIRCVLFWSCKFIFMVTVSFKILE